MDFDHSVNFRCPLAFATRFHCGNPLGGHFKSPVGSSSRVEKPALHFNAILVDLAVLSSMVVLPAF